MRDTAVVDAESQKAEAIHRLIGFGPPAASATVLALGRAVGNRRLARLIAERRLARRDTTGIDVALGARPAEEARLAGEAQRIAGARYLSATEVTEVGVLTSLGVPTKEQAAMAGVQKLLASVKAVGLAGAYSRETTPLAGTVVSFAAGDPADPDGRVGVTADGLLVIETTTRTPQKAKKGVPQPDRVTRRSRMVDLQGNEVKRPKKGTVGEAFYGTALSSLEAAESERVLSVLGASTTEVTGSVEGKHLTLGQLVTEASPKKYVQVGYLGKDNARESELATMVQHAFDQLRVEFEQFAYPDGVCDLADRPREQLVNRFADHLQPSLQQAIDQAQAADDLAWAAQQKARDNLEAAEIALRGAKVQSDSTEKLKKVKALDVKSKTKALDAARRAADAADKTVVKREVALNYQIKLREDFRATISLILDPAVSTETVATDSVGALCNVLSFYLSGKALGVVGPNTDFATYFLQEVRAGHIQRQWTPPKVSKVKGGDVEPGFYGSGVYYGTSGNVWGEQRKMERNYLTEGKDTLDDKVPLADPRRREELEAFLASGVNVAVSHQDFAHTPPSSPHHFLLIVKDDRGAWRNMDHTSNSYQRRGGLTDWAVSTGSTRMPRCSRRQPPRSRPRGRSRRPPSRLRCARRPAPEFD